MKKYVSLLLKEDQDQSRFNALSLASRFATHLGTRRFLMSGATLRTEPRYYLKVTTSA